MRRNIFVLVMACLVCLLTVSLPQAVLAASVSMEAAEKIALGHAGAGANAVAFTEMKFDRKLGRSEYKIEFVWNNIQYKYEINADSGVIIGYSRKEPKLSPWDGRNTAADSGYYSEIDAAKTAALKYAGVSADQAYFTKVELKRDKKSGAAEYKIDFFANGKKYKCKISASSGEIVEYSVKTSNNMW